MSVPYPHLRHGLRSSEAFVVLGGAGMAVASLIPWYDVELIRDDLGFDADLGDRTNGWQVPDAFLSQAGTVLGVAIAVVALLMTRQDNRPSFGTLSWGTTLTAASLVAFGLIALKYAMNNDGTMVGIYASLFSSVLQMYGAYVTRVEEGGSRPQPFGTTPPTQPLPAHRPGPPGPPARPAPPPRAMPDPQPSPLQPSQPIQPHPPTQPSQSTQPTQPTQPAAGKWPEITYLLSAWLRPGTEPATAATGYRTAFASDPDRLERLKAELQNLLDPNRPEADRAALISSIAPHAQVHGSAHDLLAYLAYYLFGPQTP